MKQGDYIHKHNIELGRDMSCINKQKYTYNLGYSSFFIVESLMNKSLIHCIIIFKKNLFL